MKLVAKRSSIINQNCLNFAKVPAILRALLSLVHAYSYSKICLFLVLRVIIGQRPILPPIKQVFLNGPRPRWSKQYANMHNNSIHVTNQHAAIGWSQCQVRSRMRTSAGHLNAWRHVYWKWRRRLRVCWMYHLRINRN